MLPDSDAIIAAIEGAANALIAGDRVGAATEIERIAHEPQQMQKRSSVPRATIAPVLWRDPCRCRDCERACVPHTVLRAITCRGSELMRQRGKPLRPSSQSEVAT